MGSDVLFGQRVLELSRIVEHAAGVIEWVGGVGDLSQACVKIGY